MTVAVDRVRMARLAGPDAAESGDGPESAGDLCAPVAGLGLIGLCGHTGLILAVVC